MVSIRSLTQPLSPIASYLPIRRGHDSLMSSAPAIMWFRRDLRLHDNPALLAASDAADGDGVLPLFIWDDRLWEPAGPARRAWMCVSLRALDESLNGHLVVRRGKPAEVLADLAKQTGATSVHIAQDFGPYGMKRDDRVREALAEIDVSLEATGSPYATDPGTILTKQGTGYKVFSPFGRAWSQHGYEDAYPRIGTRQTWLDVDSEDFPTCDDAPPELDLGTVGEEAARRKWRDFLDRLDGYDEDRDRMDRNGTSGMSPHLRWGEIHPRTILTDLKGMHDKHAQSFRSEIGWREFYADVLWREPRVVKESWRTEFEQMEWDSPDSDLVEAWKKGETGFAMVDAGMRELLATGTMHNRVRMLCASFLVKDLHVDWRVGAKYFYDHLVDGDLASNYLNWQWAAGSGTDAQPFFRIFNPDTQGDKFDPDETYRRRWIPEYGTDDYPERIVDHKEERKEALDRLSAITS